jgi:O-antigen ligase
MMMTKRIPRDLFAILVLFLSTEAFVSLFVGQATPSGVREGNVLLEFCWASIDLFVIYRCFQRRCDVASILAKNWALVALLFYAFASSAWSGDPLFSLRKGAALLLSSLFAFELAARYDFDEQRGLIFCAVAAAFSISVAITLVDPSAVPVEQFGNIVDEQLWNGIFPQKNGFGHVAALLVMCVMSWRACGLRARVFRTTSLTLLLLMIWVADTRTALIICIVMLGLWPLFGVASWRKRKLTTLGVAVGLLAVAGIGALFFVSADGLAALGRKSDLSGRTPLWSLALGSIASRPIAGYGFQGFWNVAEQSFRLRSIIGWDAPHAHNAYIDTALQLGLPGLALYLFVALSSMKKAVGYARLNNDPGRRWPLVIIVFCLLYGFTESDVLAPNWIFWIVFVCTTSSLNKPDAIVALPLSDESCKQNSAELLSSAHVATVSS